MKCLKTDWKPFFFYLDEVGRQSATVTLLHADPGREWMPSKHSSDTSAHWLTTWNLGKVRQEDCFDVWSTLSYMLSSRPTWTIERNLITHTHTQRNKWMGIKFTLLSGEFYMDTLIDCIEVILYWETALVLLMIRSTTTLWNVCVSHFTSVMEYNKWLFCKRIYQQRFKMLGKKSEIF